MSFLKNLLRPGEETVRDRSVMGALPAPREPQSLPPEDFELEEVSSLDEPFVVATTTMHPPAVVTPTGSELVLGTECDDVTRVFAGKELEDFEALRALCRPPTTAAHTRPTVREMEAVRP